MVGEGWIVDKKHVDKIGRGLFYINSSVFV